MMVLVEPMTLPLKVSPLPNITMYIIENDAILSQWTQTTTYISVKQPSMRLADENGDSSDWWLWRPFA